MTTMLRCAYVCATVLVITAPAGAWHKAYTHGGYGAGAAFVPATSAAFVTPGAAFVPSASFAPAASFVPMASTAIVPTVSSAFVPTMSASFVPAMGSASFSGGCSGGMAGVSFVPNVSMANVALAPSTAFAPQASFANAQAAFSLSDLTNILGIFSDFMRTRDRSPALPDSGSNNAFRQKLSGIEDRLDTLEDRVRRIERRVSILTSDDTEDLNNDRKILPRRRVPGTFGNRLSSTVEQISAIRSDPAGAVGTADQLLSAIALVHRQNVQAYANMNDNEKKTPAGMQLKEEIDHVDKFFKALKGGQ